MFKTLSSTNLLEFLFVLGTNTTKINDINKTSAVQFFRNNVHQIMLIKLQMF